jgi:hypothetical protein
MHIQCYRNKTAKQFVNNFLKRAVKVMMIKISSNILVVLDNLSVHKSKKVKEVVAKDCPRIKFVFLPVRSLELNLIKAIRWLWLQRHTAINNSTFKDEIGIGKTTVNKWKNIYNRKHTRAIINILQEEDPCVYTAVNRVLQNII